MALKISKTIHPEPNLVKALDTLLPKEKTSAEPTASFPDVVASFKENVKAAMAETIAVEMPALTQSMPKVGSGQTQAMSEVEALVHEYITLQQKYDEYEVKALTKRMDELKKQMQSIANAEGEDGKPYKFTAPNGYVLFSERGEVAEVENPLELVKHIQTHFGPAAANAIVKIGITELRKILTEAELKNWIKKNPGSRTLKAAVATGE